MIPTLTKLGWSAWAFTQVRHERRIPWESAEQLERRQRLRVQRMLRFAHARVPFYREAMQASGLEPRDIRQAGDLRHLPLIDSEMLRNTPEAFQPRPPRHGSRLRLVSSGTSGRAKTTVYDTAALVASLVHAHRQRHVIGHFLGRSLAYRELAVIKQGGAFDQVRRFYDEHLWVPRRAQVVRRTLEAGALTPAEEVAFMNDFAADVVVGNGSDLGPLFRTIAAHGGLRVWPRVIVYGGDAMLPADRAFIHATLNIPVLSVYQASESMRIGFECKERRWLHNSLDACAVRLVNADGHEAPCPCGRNLPQFQLLEGRSADVVRRRDGRTVHALTLVDQLRKATGVERLQIVQDEWNAFVVRLVPDTDVDRAIIADRVGHTLTMLTGETCRVQLEWPDALPREASGKIRLVISRLPGELTGVPSPSGHITKL